MQTKFAPLFVVGCERSGTTLLAAMLDRHSQVAVPPETLFFSDVVHHAFWRRSARSHKQLLAAALKGRVGEFSLDQAALLKSFQEGPCSFPALFQCILQAHAARMGKARPGEKSILHVLYLPQLLGWFPDAQFLAIIRDGRDVVSSMMSKPWKPNKLRAKCCNWRLKTRLLMRCQELHPGRMKTVRYEELLQDPRRVLGEVDQFLGLPFEEGQLDPSARTGVYLDRELPYKSKVLQPIDASRAFAWKKKLGEGQLRAMNSIMGPTLAGLGYESAGAGPRPALRDRLLNLFWIPAFALLVRCNGLIIYDKARYLWRRRVRALSMLSTHEEPTP